MSERHQSKERQEKRHYQERAPRNASLDVNVNTTRTPRLPARESRYITGPVERAPGGALVLEAPLVEEALRKARASAPAPRYASLEVEANPSREPHTNVRFRGYSVFIW